MNIPKLKTTKFNYAKEFISNYLDCTDKDIFFETVKGKFPNVILDIFDTKMNGQNEKLSLLNNEYFRLSQEYKYINFIEEVFSINNNKCFVKLTFSNKPNHILKTIDSLDIIDRLIFLNQELEFCDNTDTNFIIEDINLLKMFLKLILREIMSIDLYFDKKPLLLFSNYDLSLPVAFKTIEDMTMYEKISKKHNLYFR